MKIIRALQNLKMWYKVSYIKIFYHNFNGKDKYKFQAIHFVKLFGETILLENFKSTPRGVPKKR